MKRSISRYIAYVLRHNPSSAGIELDERGWADVNELIDGVRNTGRALDLRTLEEIVQSDGKRRFDFNADNTKIRANQGHSIKVDVEMTVCAPPDILYHGTAEKNLENIKKSGILKGNRNYVHLSKDVESAIKVGLRHGKAVALKIDAKKMYEEGCVFLLSSNGVWQTDRVESKYIIEEIRN